VRFVLPGIAVQALLFVTMNTAVALNADVHTGIFDRFRSLPIARSAPLSGHVLGDLAKYAVSLMLVFGFGAILGFRPHGSPLAVLAGRGLIMLFTFAVSWISALVAMLARSAASVQGLAFVLIFPAHLRQQRVRPDRTTARLAAGLGEDQPSDPGLRRRPRAAAGPGAGPHGHHLAGVDRGHPRGVRPAGGPHLPPQL
jgi:ABC-2 type transporter